MNRAAPRILYSAVTQHNNNKRFGKAIKETELLKGGNQAEKERSEGALTIWPAITPQIVI